MSVTYIGDYCDFAAGKVWKQVSFNSCFHRRGWGQVISCSSTTTIFMLGGFDGSGQCLNDVWCSKDDGKSWAVVNPKCPWSGRAVFGSCISSDGSCFYVLGGSSTEKGGFCNDVWVSHDFGHSWRCASESAEWCPRSGFACAVNPADPNDITVFGGSSTNFTCLNDAWRSTDAGRSWYAVSPKSPWEPRVDMATCQLSSGRIILSGGDDWEHNFYGDVWASDDRGATWSVVTAQAPWQPRAGHALISLADGSLRLIGGNVTCLKANKAFREHDIERLADVWTSIDGGTTWRILSRETDFGPRTLHKALATADGRGLVLVGGWQGASGRWQQSNAFYGDVWLSRPHAEELDRQSKILTAIGSFLPIAEDVWRENVIPCLLL